MRWQLLKLRRKEPERDPLSSAQIKDCPSEQGLSGGVIGYGVAVAEAKLINHH